jgi:hypothetical protein
MKNMPAQLWCLPCAHRWPAVCSRRPGWSQILRHRGSSHRPRPAPTRDDAGRAKTLNVPGRKRRPESGGARPCGAGPCANTACSYSHLGIAYQVPDAQGGQRAGACCTSSTSAARPVPALYRQGLGEFFLDDLWRYRGRMAGAHTAEVQQQAEGAAAARAPGADRPAPQALQHRQLRLGSKSTSSPTSGPLETLALPAWTPRIATRGDAAQAWLQSAGYRPAVLNGWAAGPPWRTGGRRQRGV